MEKVTINNIYELYFKCSCNDRRTRWPLITKEDYIYHIEKINCRLLKKYPFHEDDTPNYKKYDLLEKYHDKFGEPYSDNLSPCKRKELFNTYLNY